MRCIFLSFSAILISTLAIAPASAETFYSLVFDTSFVTLTPTQSRRLSVFLEETSTAAGDTTRLSDGDAGLIQGAFQIAREGMGDTMITAAAIGPGFAAGSSIAEVGPPTVIRNAVTLGASQTGTTSVASGITTNQLLLGTIDLVAGNSIGATNTFRLGLTGDPLGPDFVADDGFELDNAISSFGTVTVVTAVPEPGTMALLGIGLSGYAINRRRLGAVRKRTLAT